VVKKMTPKLPSDPNELAKYRGIPAYHIIERKFLAVIAGSKWGQAAADFLTLSKPVSEYAYPLLSNWDFAVSPGSGAHHTHFGGLASHTLQNLEYAESWADVYDRRGLAVNRDLLYATIIIHDSMKRFLYQFDEAYNLKKAEDPFIAKKEDHHSWVIREMTARGCDKELVLSVAAIHGIDDVTLESGVRGAAVVNHYLAIGQAGLQYSEDDVRSEHVIAFLADSDWHWSGQAQRKTGVLAEQMAADCGTSPGHMKIYLGSRFTYEKVGWCIEQYGYEQAKEQFAAMIGAQAGGECAAALRERHAQV